MLSNLLVVFLSYRKQNIHKKSNNVLRRGGQGCSPHHTLSKDFKVLCIELHWRRSSLWPNQMLHPHNIPESPTDVLSTYIVLLCLSSVESTVGAVLLVLKQLDAVLALSLQDSDLQSNALRTGWGKCLKKRKKRDASGLFHTCFKTLKSVESYISLLFSCMSIFWFYGPFI